MTITDRLPLERIGLWLFALGMIGLGLTSVAFQTYLPGLHPSPESWGAARIGPVLVGLVIGATGGLLLARLRARAALSLAIMWLGWLLVGHTLNLIAAPGDITRWVGASQAAVFMLTALALASAGQTIATARRIGVGAMLILFGAVHLLYPAAISGLLPDGFPARELWPWLTGPLQITAGMALATGLFIRAAAVVITAMFLGWVVVLHLARVVASPGDAFEWTFMLTAVALSGVVAMAARSRTARD